MTDIGKDVIVDPTNTDEELTAEMLGATEVLEYHDPSEKLEALRRRIRTIGINRVADESGINRRTLQRFCNAGTSLRLSSLRRLEASIAQTI